MASLPSSFALTPLLGPSDEKRFRPYSTTPQIETFSGDRAGRSQAPEHELSRMAALLSGVQQPVLDPYLP
ncbi:hypothetical protein ACWEPL_61560 [Nonomuraea sp. NPDC004186]